MELVFRPRIDYEYKSFVLKEHNDLLGYVKKCSRRDYIERQLIDNGVVLKMPKSDRELRPVYSLISQYTENGDFRIIKECLRINGASFKRAKRLETRINAIISQFDSVFLTLTFTDKALSETSALTRRRMVSRFLRSFNAPYVANIDFGVDDSKTKREHYHAVIGSQSIDYSLWPYGAVNGKRIKVKNDKALAKYVSKLSNHAIKEQARRSALLYSR